MVKMIYSLVNIGVSLVIGIIFISTSLLLKKDHRQILMQYLAIEQLDL